MSEELSLITATPVVKLTKVSGPYNIEVQAEGSYPTLSLHYRARTDGVPMVKEKLLVAVLAGVNPNRLLDKDGTRWGR